MFGELEAAAPGRCLMKARPLFAGDKNLNSRWQTPSDSFRLIQCSREAVMETSVSSFPLRDDHGRSLARVPPCTRRRVLFPAVKTSSPASFRVVTRDMPHSLPSRRTLVARDRRH